MLEGPGAEAGQAGGGKVAGVQGHEGDGQHGRASDVGRCGGRGQAI